jgi:hypothetical protein
MSLSQTHRECLRLTATGHMLGHDLGFVRRCLGYDCRQLARFLSCDVSEIRQREKSPRRIPPRICMRLRLIFLFMLYRHMPLGPAIRTVEGLRYPRALHRGH